MTTTNTNNTVAIVTREQIEACTRFEDAQGQAFYMVVSESDPTVEYEVRAQKFGVRYYMTCTCKAGLQGVACKHKRWAAAAAQVDKAQVKVSAMTRPTETYTNVDARAMARVENAKPQATSGKQVEQDAKHYAPQAFRLMR